MRFASKVGMTMAALAICGAAMGQQKTNPNTGINWPLATGHGAPTSACTSANYFQPYQDQSVTPNVDYTCGNDGWKIRGGPAGPAGPQGPPGTSNLLGTQGTANVSNGAGVPQLSDILSTAPARVNDFGDSKCAGAFTGGPALSFSGIWDSVFEQQATTNYQCISSQSAADVANQVYATTFANTDKSMIGTATNDTFTMGSGDDQYYHSVLDLAAYAAIPDGKTLSGYPAKTPGTALTWASGTCTTGATGTYYPITTICPTGSVSNPIGFVGDHFYLSVDTNQAANFNISIAFDGGTSYVYGPIGYVGCSHPYCFQYLSHLNSYTYSPYLLRIPMLTGGRNTYHTAVITVTGTGPAPINWVGSNGAAVLYLGPQVVIPNLEQEGGDTLGTKANVADLTTTAIVGELSADGLNVVKADVSGMLNYYAGPNVTVTGTTVSGSPTITVTGSTGTVNLGMGLSGSGWAAPSQVFSIGSGTITMATNSTVTNSTPVTFTGNGNWANTLHEDKAGALIKAQALGRAASPLTNGKFTSYALFSDNYFSTSFTIAAFNGITGLGGYSAAWTMPFPAQLVSVSVSNTGAQASCTTTTTTSYVQINSLTSGFPIFVNAYFAGPNTYILAPAMTYLNGGPVDDLVGGDTLVATMHGYVGTGCTAGNTTTTVTATWKRL
jgi:hypothetical protein